MQLSIAKDIFGSPWHIDASGIQQYFPVLTGMINGAVIVEESEPKENRQFAISIKTLSPVQWSQPEEDLPDDEEQREEPLKEKVVHVLPVRGIMMKHDMMCGPAGTRTLANRLKSADADEMVMGHVMIFEGPGGAANAVPELADAMRECKKPIVGWVDGLAASAHQYVLSYCTEKWASRPTDIVGSIGTMIMFTGRKSKSDEDTFKNRQVTIYADQAFEKNEEYEKAINDFDFSLTKERVLNPHNKKFQDDIRTNCPGVEDKHLHGRTFEAAEVIGSLIEKIGSFQDAVKRVVELAGNNPCETENSNTNNLKNITSMKQFTLLNAVLGVPSLESVDEVVSLNEEQLLEIEGALEQTNLVVAERDTAFGERDTANAARDLAVTEREAATAERETAVADRTTAQNELAGAIALLDAIDTTVAAAQTPAEKAAAISALLASKPGDKPAGNLETEDPEVEEFDGFTEEEKEVTKNL